MKNGELEAFRKILKKQNFDFPYDLEIQHFRHCELGFSDCVKN